MSYSSYDSAEKTSGGTPLYGMDVEMHRKKEAKRGDSAEKEAQAWIEAILGISFDAPFEEFLKDGIVLCNLINAIKPGSVSRINRMRQPFMLMENIEAYCNACRTFGIKEFELFRTVDLWEAKNIPAVVNNLHALGRACQKLPGFTGPTLGAKMAEAQRTEFSEKQLGEAAGAIPMFLTQNKKLDAAGWNVDITSDVVRAPPSGESAGVIPRMATSNKPLDPSGWNTDISREVVRGPQGSVGSESAAPPRPALSPPPPPPPAAPAAAPLSPPAPAVESVTVQAAQLTLEDLERLASLKERGIISEEEFNAKKRQILGL